MKKILIGIEPFNDIYYYNCFYNSFFSVLKFYNKSLIPYLTRSTIYYTANPKGITFDMDYLIGTKFEVVLERSGIEVSSMKISSNIVEDAIASISNERPVIIWVDCFYESFRPDMYMKEHWPHTLLIYGFNQEEQLVYVIENKHRDTLSYEKRTLNFEELKNCYEGFIQNLYRKPWSDTYMEYGLILQNKAHRGEEKISVQYFEDYIKHVNNNKDSISGGIELFKDITYKYCEIINDKDSLNEYIDTIIEGVNRIINAKLLEKYKLSLIIQNDDKCIPGIQAIIDNWCFIRSKLVRFYYSKFYNLEDLISTIEKLELIYELEKKCLEEFTNI